MYVRRVQNQILEFGHRGWLLDESFIFYDRQTDSLWTQATGKCILGRFKGEQLATLPVTHTTWEEWRTLHPETLVLAKPVHLITRYLHDGYSAYYARRRVQFGLAVFTAGTQKLYPLEQLQANPLVEDRIADQPVLVVFHEPSGTAVAFDPVIAGKQVKFELSESTSHEMWLRDRDSGVVWSGLTGRPQPTEESISALRQLRTTQFNMANWLQHFPNSPIYSP